MHRLMAGRNVHAKCRKATLSTVEKCFFLVFPFGKLGQLPWDIVVSSFILGSEKSGCVYVFTEPKISKQCQVKCSMTRHARRSHRHSILLELECVNPISIYINRHLNVLMHLYLFYIFLCLFSGMYKALWTFTLMGGCVCGWVSKNVGIQLA